MSGHEKPQDVKEYDTTRRSQAYSSLADYHARRPSQDPMYLQYALPGAADPQLQQPSAAYDRQIDHMNYGASPVYQSRATLEATSPAFHDFEPRKVPLVSSHDPQQGTKGTLVYVYLDSSSDLLSPTPLIATLMFATRSVPAALTRLEAREQDVCYKYLVSATAPAFSETASSNLKIPLRLQLQEQTRLNVSLIDVGEWLYEDGKRLEHRSCPQEVSRKRKITDQPSVNPRSTKRGTPSEQQTTQSQEYGSYSYPSASLAYPPSLHDLDFPTFQRKYTAWGRSQLQQSLQPDPNAMMSQAPTGGASTSQALMRPPAGQTSSWNPSYRTGYQSDRNPQSNVAPSVQVSSLPSPTPANPRFVRSTTLAHQPSLGTTSAASSSDGSVNSYTLFSNRAVLEIPENLNAMQENWTPEERTVRRRVVRFWRGQNGTTISAYFKAVKADDQALPRGPNECRVSCIYWEERDECYLTSVDTIKLLEFLITIGEEFSVEEKNRVRRNLEGYKPCTIWKGRDETESFFKLIMGFPKPTQPRIIEKDVKVFSWRILEQALKKIVGKYCASPVAIAGPIRRQPSSNFRGPKSEDSASRYSALSSRSASSSTASGSYAPTLGSSTFSPATASHSLSSYSQTPPLQQLSAPGLSHTYTVPTLSSQYMPTDTSNSPYAAQVSIPSLSSAYTASCVRRRRSSDAPTDDTLASTSHYPRRPRTSTSFASPYTPQGSSEATATLGLPGRASMDLSAYSAYFDTDAASSGSMGDGQYTRHSGVNDETEETRFKDE